eukprot:1159666-Pelagomonas_calceolata.AAC.8
MATWVVHHKPVWHHIPSNIHSNEIYMVNAHICVCVLTRNGCTPQRPETGTLSGIFMGCCAEASWMGKCIVYRKALKAKNSYDD